MILRGFLVSISLLISTFLFRSTKKFNYKHIVNTFFKTFKYPSFSCIRSKIGTLNLKCVNLRIQKSIFTFRFSFMENNKFKESTMASNIKGNPAAKIKELNFDISELETKANEVPSFINPTWVLSFFKKDVFDKMKLKTLKLNYGLQQDKLAHLLDVTPKTLKKYEDGESKMKRHTQEHGLMLLSLLEHGKKTFGSFELFNEWLLRKNQLLDFNAPLDYLGSISGVLFIENRLTNLAYGDNA